MAAGRGGRLSASLEDYLEAIFELLGDGVAVRSTDVARRLGVGKPAVAAALKALAGRGYISHDPYRAVELTERGRALAAEVVRRHEILQEFLHGMLGVPLPEAAASACRMEHVIRGEALERLVRFVEFFAACPRGRDLLAEFTQSCAAGIDVTRCSRCVDDLRGRLGGEAAASARRTTLGELSPGQRGVVLSLSGEKGFRRRLCDMGITRGALVAVERVAPMGDPMQIRVRGYHLSMRRVDASSVAVERVDDDCR